MVVSTLKWYHTEAITLMETVIEPKQEIRGPRETGNILQMLYNIVMLRQVIYLIPLSTNLPLKSQ